LNDEIIVLKGWVEYSCLSPVVSNL
jgi:hypothetical protein